ncbi:hypothetical protein [Nocardia concava]|uniref:hypothetical protein n=1 Tax=Nocardia concava TaxID=257281 RepID=UPI00031BE7E2|nr:hypothetical protein [Nocardia concava]
MSDQVFPSGPQRYATGQLSRALTAVARAGTNRADRERAEAKAQRWRAVIDGLTTGRVAVGSRTPVADLPAWVTLEVTHGGFTTGRGLAEAPLTQDEGERLAELPRDVPGETPRERLNLWYLGDAGQSELLSALHTGHYRIQIPEHGALMAVALLLDKGFPEQALDLVAELRPYMSRLRFTPAFDPVARPSGALVRVASVGDTTDALRAVRTPEQLSLMHTTIDVWTPLYDRLVALWCATVAGDLPRLDATGAVTGGYPNTLRPPHWPDERARWLSDFGAARLIHEFRGRHAHPKSNFTRLHDALLSVKSGLTPRQVGWVRRALANTVSRHGEPGSAARESARVEQAGAISAPLYRDLAAVLAARLDRFPADGGLPSLDPVTTPVEPGDKVDIADGTPIPQHLQDKAIRALEAPADELVRRGVIGSGEVLATVLPQLTSRLLAADITDPAAANLYEQLYTAFRRRRSLLLLNLQHQVRFDELPWVTALHVLRPTESGKQADSGTAPAARRLLRQTALLAIESFPQTALPNPLVREFHTLAQQADLRLPLVEEVAADIFMGTFTEKWRAAAIVASGTLDGTLYQRYYDLPSVAEWNAGARTGKRRGKATATDFTELCARRAEEAGTGENYVARNGALLEQSQILTTHNLAVLVNALDLDAQLRETATELVRRTFTWIVRCLSRPADWHTRLIQVKNAAYAWRQAVFLLSYCDLAVQRDQIDWLIAQHWTMAQHARGLGPAIDGLAHVVAGGRFAPGGMVPNASGRRFLGWTVGRHWYFD